MKRRMVIQLTLIVTSLVLFVSCFPKNDLATSSTSQKPPDTISVLPTQSPNYPATYGIETQDSKSTGDAIERAATQEYMLSTIPEIDFSNYFGQWELVEYYREEYRSTPTPRFLEIIEKMIGRNVFLSENEIIDNTGLFYSEYCENPEYYWINRYTEGLDWFVLPPDHPESKYNSADVKDAFYFEVYCDDTNQVDFEVSAIDRLVIFNSDVWFFFERVDPITSTMEIPTYTPVPPTATVTPKAPKPTENENNYISPLDNAPLVYIPAGEFIMGTSLDEVNSLIEECIEEVGVDFTESCENQYNAEAPQHTVYLDEFWIDKYEVTNAMFASFLNDINWWPYKSEPYYIWADRMPPMFIHYTGDSWIADEGYENLPIWQVHWQGANDYCEWAGRRLPTEAEWEKAARGDDGRQYPWGDEEPNCYLVKTLNCDTEHYYHVAVDQLPGGASPYGVFNMLGNVGEWVSDWYDIDYYSYSPDENPKGPETGTYRVVRGDQDFPFFTLRTPIRDYFFVDNIVRSQYGFRCATSSDR